MKVYLVRHAEAVDIGEQGVRTDAERCLTEQGRADAATLGRALRRLDVRVGTVLSSPLVRARQTAELVARELAGKPTIALCPALAPPGDAGDLCRRIEDADGYLLFVGHAPFLGAFLQHLLNGIDEPPIDLAKCTAACIRLEGHDASLRWLIDRKLSRTLANDA